MYPAFFRYIRRSLIWIIILVVAVVLADYLHTLYVRSRTGADEISRLGSEIAQSAKGVEYYVYEDAAPQFQIVARQLNETRAGKVFLQGINAFDFNPDGSVHNKISSLYAEYDPANKIVDFKQDVRLSLGEEIELYTESVHYDVNANIGTTQDPVRFYSDRMTGNSRGLIYDLDHKSLELKNEVDFLLGMGKVLPDGSNAIEEIRARSQTAFCSEKTGNVKFLGNARLESDTMLLTADMIEATVDSDRKELSSLTSTGNASYRSGDPGESRILSGDRMLFHIHPVNRNLESVFVSGNADLDFQSPSEERRLSGDEIDLYIDPELNIPLRIEGRTGIRFRIGGETERTVISGELFKAFFYPETRELKNIDVRQQAEISMKGTAGSAGNDLRADWISIDFRRNMGTGAPDTIRAEGTAQWISRSVSETGADGQASSGKLNAEVIEMFFVQDGGFLDRIDASGNVVMTEMSSGSNPGAWTREIFSDRSSIRFYPGENSPKDMDAEGAVRIVYETASESARPGSEGFQTSSDRLKAAFAQDSEDVRIVSASQWGNFRYEDGTRSATSGKCDYDTRKEEIILSDSPQISFEIGSASGETVEFYREQGILRILGDVRSILSEGKGAGFWGEAADSSRVVLADIMQYQEESGDIRYEKNVLLLSEDQQLQAELLDILDGGAKIEAKGNIRHHISRNSASDSEKAQGSHPSIPVSKEAGYSGDMPINIESSRLDYAREGNTLNYSGNVVLSHSDFTMTSDTLEILLDQENNAISKATAKGNIVVHKGNIECKGDTAYYFSSPERFEVIGSPAEYFDPENGRSFAPRLTSNVADDRILLGGSID